MDTRIIEYVIAIAEEKSISKAAERLYITQPALSQRLKKLEEELGTPLFKREGNSMNLTDAGRIYVNGGYSVLQIKQEAMQKLRNVSNEGGNILRFGCATSLALTCIPAFREKYPDTDLTARRCNTPTAREALLNGDMDMAVLLTTSLQHNTLEYLPLAEGELLLAIPRDHAPVGETEDGLPDYESLSDDYFILNPSPSQSRVMEDTALGEMGISPHILCEIPDNDSRRYMLNQGIGDAFLPSYDVRDTDSFRTFSLNPPVKFFIVAAYPRSISLSEPMKTMLKLLLTIFDTTPSLN